MASYKAYNRSRFRLDQMSYRIISFYYVVILIHLSLFPLTPVLADDSKDNNLNNCTREGFDLAYLDTFSPWMTVNDNTNASFHIQLCSKLKIDQSSGITNCPDGTSVCAHYPNGTVVNFGSYVADPPTTTGSQDGELLMVLKGQACPHFDGELYSTVFYFKCGKTLGHPSHIGDLGCSTHFEWESYIFCKDLPIPKSEVPCTVMKDGHLIDLSPLIKLTGGYLVDDTENRKIFINVCRDMKQGKSTEANNPLSHCPEGSASCRLLNDKDGEDYGSPTQRLEATSSGVKLVYTTSKSKPNGCLDYPTTTINFRCPKRGGSKDPVLVTDFLVSCSVEIEWVTEYACPVDYIYSESCQLTSTQHDVEIDLSPLKHQVLSDHPYTVNVTHDTGDSYIYYLNVCEKLGFQCGNDSTGLSSVCQKTIVDEKDKTQHQRSWSGGQDHFMKLRYSDGDLTMIYRHGDPCHTHFRRTSFINFVCNKTAVNDGKGYPTFVSHENCSYTFEWQTKYACVDHPVEDTCRVDFKGKRYDLSPLVKEQSGYWQVLVGDNEESDTSYFLNICHAVFKQESAEGCPIGSAMCSKGLDGFTSLGKYTKPLQYDEDSKSLKLVYTDGDKTGNDCLRSTVINFYCLPGVMDSAPILVHKSLDGCYYEVEWHTAAACVLSHKKGDDCKVVDDNAGYTFDLNALKTNESYTVDTDKYTYYINVCEEIKGKNNPCSVPPHSGAAICQVEKQSGSHMKKIAEPATLLEYYDGVVNLTYTNGEAYNNPEHTPRSAEIAFECDMTTGKGKPEFLEEKDFTYAFRWRTSYACPVQPIECTATDMEKNVQYDLSSLSKTTENWVWIDDDATKKTRQKFYMNVCRPLSKTKNMLCSHFASVCVTYIDEHGKESLVHGNLGKVTESPKPEKTLSGVKIVYSNGNDCKDGDVDKKYTTTIHFVCVKGKLTGAPAKPVLIRPCEYSILWETEAACHVETTSSSSQDEDKSGTCSIKDPNSDYVFNLKPLAKRGDDYYSITHATTTYKFNICGKLPDSVCGKFESSHDTSVCEDSKAVASLASDLSYSTTGELSLEYKGKNNLATGVQKKYKLIFVCDRHAQTPVMKFEKQESVETVFHISTALVCSPQSLDCAVQDNFGRQYDLSPLALKDRNWIVIDNRPAHSNLRYHINVCRPVNPTTTINCPGGAVGACQTGDASFNLGYVQSKPVVASNGSAITIRYQGGDICHRGKPNEAQRSTRIIFTCDKADHDPVFLSESETCEYSFIWKTPSACAQHSTTGSDCKVKEELYDFEFDLTSLRKASENYVVKGAGYNFTLNLCGPIVTSPDSCPGDNVGACQTGGALTSPVEIGKSNANVIYDSGELRLVYTEGKVKCHSQFTRRTIIRFVCDDTKSGEAGPSYVQETSECVYEFIWNTRLACPPHQVKDCTFRDGNNVYDLTSLEKFSENYERDTVKSKYILNVCRSLVHKKGQTCPFNAAACEINLTATDEKKKYRSLGDVSTTSLSLEQGKLVLRYTNGDMCDDGKTKMSTQVVFDCDKSSDALGIPSSHFVVSGCKHYFLWKSRAACPLSQAGGDDTKGTLGDCKVKNPQTGYEFDLSGLKKSSGYKTYDREGHMFTLNVCGGIDSVAGCPDGTGSCQSGMTAGEHAVNAGKANTNLIFRDGVIALEYKDGALCKTGNSRRSTIINFVCMSGSGNGLPVYIDKSSDCLYYFDWHTDLVCEKQITCSVNTETGLTLDFSPLVQHSGKYNVLPNAVGTNKSPGVIYLNLCRPLNPVFGTLCPPGSGTCLVQPDQKPVSLGHVHEDLVYDAATKQVKLTYAHGDPCPSNPKINSSSIIILKCGHNDYLKDPELDLVTSECQYVFVWITPYACQKKPTVPYSSCSFYDDKDSVTYDLSPLTDEVQVPSTHGGTFTIKACGHFEEKGEKGDASCSQAAVCLKNSKGQDGSYGTYKDAEVKLHTDTKAVRFAGGKHCRPGGFSDSKASSTIHFKCGSTEGNGQPVIIADGDCDAVFEWSTSLVCPPIRKECLITDDGSLFDFSLLSQDTGSWNYTDSEKNVYWLNLCQGVHGPALQSKCPHNSAICMKAADGFTYMLGDVNTQSIKATGDQKDKKFVIQYTDGDTSVCTRGRRRRSDNQPVVLISLKCADTIGAPVLTKHDKEKCTYEFSWNTRMACPTEHTPAPVKEKDGLINDKRSGQTIDLNSLLKPGNNAELTIGDQRYLVNLHGQLDLSKEPSDVSACHKAAVCHYSGKTKKYRNLGSYVKRTYYLLDEQLEVKFMAPSKCSKAKSSINVSSTIIFDCVHDKSQHGLDFLYQTSDCAYVFMWKTDIVCLQTPASGTESGSEKATDSDDKSDNTSSGGSGVSGKKVAVGFLVFFIVAFVCVLVLVLHKQERRATVKSTLKRCVLCRRRAEPQFSYSMLSQSADDNELDLKYNDDDDPFNPFNEPDEEAEINNGHLPATMRMYHDDSDDDIIT